MPSPNPGESKKDYIARFMKSGEANTDFPDEKQRLAVAYSMFEKRNSPNMYGQEHPWPKAFKCSFIEPGVVFYQDLGECKVCGNARSCGEGKCETEGATVLVKQECLSKMAQSFVGKPVIDMMHKDVTPETVAEGEADGIVTRVWLDDKSGWWMCEFLVWDPETQMHCESTAYSVSCAYEPTDVDGAGGEYHNIPYAEEILNGEYTHLAIVTNPRYEGARIFVNSKGGKMSWRFWEKGSRKNAAPLDPMKTKVNVDGAEVALNDLYEAAKEPKEEAPMLNDDTVLEVDGKEKTLGELKQAYRNKLSAKKNAEGEAVKTSAPADAGQGNHEEGKGGFEHAGSCDHCRHPAFNADEAGAKPLAEEPLPDMRRTDTPPADKKNAEDAAKLAEEKKNAEADAAAKAAEEKKNAEDAAAAKAAEDKAAAEKALIEKRNAGKRSFESLRNARSAELTGDSAKISPASMDDRLAMGAKKYGSA